MEVQFSIIIPTLNEAEFLPKLLSCLSRQTYKKFEVIIVDGSSSDNTVSIAQEFSSKLPKLYIITHQKKNVSLQRNTGAHEASGDYLVFFDADVKIGDTFIEELYESLYIHHYSLVTTNITADGFNLVQHAITTSANVLRTVFIWLGKPTAGGYNIIVKNSVFRELKGFDPTIVHGEDVDFLFRCYKHGILLKSLAHPKQILSFRRYERFGYIKSCKNMVTAACYMFLRGPIKKKIFDYPMGGETYERND